MATVITHRMSLLLRKNTNCHMMMIMMMRDLVLIQSVYVSWCGDGEYANLYERNA